MIPKKDHLGAQYLNNDRMYANYATQNVLAHTKLWSNTFHNICNIEYVGNKETN